MTTPNTQGASWDSRIDYNAHDMGEMGMFIRVDYAKNILKEAVSKERAEGERRERERILTALDLGDVWDGGPGGEEWKPLTAQQFKDEVIKSITLPADSTEGHLPT